jgi:hypothetical protein
MTSNHPSKPSRKITFENGSCESKVVSDSCGVSDPHVEDTEWELKEKAAVDSLLKLREASINSIKDPKFILPSADYIESTLRCENCDSAPDVGLVTAFLLYLYSGEYSFLGEYYKKQWSDRGYISTTDSTFKGGSEEFVAIKTNKKEKKRIKKKSKKESIGKQAVKRKSALPETNKRKKSTKSSDAIDKVPEKKKRKIGMDDKTKKSKCTDKSSEKYVLRLEVDNQANIKIIPTLRRGGKIKMQDTIVEDCGNDEIKNRPVIENSIDKNKEIEMNNINKKTKNNYPCTICKDEFTSKNGLNYHTKFVHSEEKMKIIKPFHCPNSECGKKYKNKNGLNYHMTHYHPQNR